MDENNNNGFQGYESTEPVKPVKKKKKGTAIKVIIIVILCCIVAAVLAVGGYTIYTRYQAGGIKAVLNPSMPIESTSDSEPVEEPIVIVTPEPSSDESKPVTKGTDNSDKKQDDSKESSTSDSDELTAAQLYEQNVNAMVSISTSITGYNAWGQKVTGAAAGSGFIVADEGYVLTNYHVIEDANSITVYTYDGQSYDAKLIGYDETNDIAVLKISGDSAFQTVVIGDSDKCKVGEEVVAIGNSLGTLDFSMTRGIISGLARNVQVSTTNTMTLIQTDCTINSGNSGGALFNMYGEVIGITNAKYSSSGSSTEAAIENVAFAIPMNSVIEIVDNIVNGKQSTTPYIGVTVTDVSTDVANATGISSGAYIYSVTEGSPAEEAGIRVGDIIVKANDEDIDSYTELSQFISKCSPGDKVDFTLYRQGKKQTVEAVIGEKVDENVVTGSDLENEQQDASVQDEQNYGYYGYGNGNGNSYGYGNGNSYGYGNGNYNDYSNGSENSGNSDSNYYGGYGSMPDVFSYIFGNGNYGY